MQIKKVNTPKSQQIRLADAMASLERAALKVAKIKSESKVVVKATKVIPKKVTKKTPATKTKKKV